MMILELFNALSNMLKSSPQVALFGSFIWGTLSIVLSPCHLASIPLIVGFIDDQGSITTRRAAILSTLFSAGILITISLIGIITGLMGRLLGDVGFFGNYVVSVFLVIIGLYLLGVVPLPFLDKGIGQPDFKKKGIVASFLLGLIFGIALGPCTFAYMAPILGVAFSVATTSIIFSANLMLAYAVGHCLVIVLAGTFTGAVHHYLKWNEMSKTPILLKKICGIFVIFAGAYIIFTAG